MIDDLIVEGRCQSFVITTYVIYLPRPTREKVFVDSVIKYNQIKTVDSVIKYSQIKTEYKHKLT
jgi:hypothetical protein